MDPHGFPAGAEAFGDTTDGFVEERVIELAGNAQGLGQVGGTDVENIHRIAGGVQDFVQPLHRLFGLDLDGEDRSPFSRFGHLDKGQRSVTVRPAPPGHPLIPAG